jgi:hypothetical protein
VAGWRVGGVGERRAGGVAGHEVAGARTGGRAAAPSVISAAAAGEVAFVCVLSSYRARAPYRHPVVPTTVPSPTRRWVPRLRRAPSSCACGSYVQVGFVRRPACSRSSMRLRGRVTCMYVWMYVRYEMGGCCVRCLSPCQGLGPLCPASQCQGCAYVHMHIYAYAYALARALALPVRVCVPHLSCLLCSALSSHVPCSYDMSAHARAHAALGADMHMCMGACPAGCWCGRLLPAIRSLYQIRKGFGSCRVPVRLLPHSCGVHVPHRVPALADVCRQVRPAGHTARSRAVRLLQTASSASPVPGLPRARPHRCCWALRGLVRRLDAPHLWGSIPRTL